MTLLLSSVNSLWFFSFFQTVLYFVTDLFSFVSHMLCPSIETRLSFHWNHHILSSSLSRTSLSQSLSLWIIFSLVLFLEFKLGVKYWKQIHRGELKRRWGNLWQSESSTVGKVAQQAGTIHSEFSTKAWFVFTACAYLTSFFFGLASDLFFHCLQWVFSLSKISTYLYLWLKSIFLSQEWLI